MKYRYLVILLLFTYSTLSLVSCGEEIGGPNTQQNEEPEPEPEPDLPSGEFADSPNPDDLAELDNLYVLRDYVNTKSYPDFMLGAAASILDFNNKEMIYTLVTKNFDQVVATYHMKHEAVVKSTGDMDFTNVDKFVNLCDAADVEIYGHTLCWYRSNNTTYLNSVIDAAKATTSNTADQAVAVDTAVTNAMEEWVQAMVQHTPNVKAWDVVNEAISDSSPYELRRGDGSTPSGGNFYWVDYMGDDYVRDVVYFARKHGGNDLKLFINDYGLEWKHINHAKLYSLIDLIEYWESDGITVIDGIGTQMHLNYSIVEGTQNYYKNEVKMMFEIMATTDKLIKISELDITLLDANGNYISAESATEEQHLMLADYYEYIIECYFDILSPDQYYGITHWSIVDAAENEEYRWGPVGLWNLDYERKPEYAGFVKGLYNMWE